MKVQPVVSRTRHTRRYGWWHQLVAERPIGRVHESGDEQLYGRGLRHRYRDDAEHAHWQMGARVTWPSQLCVAQTECHAPRPVTILSEYAAVFNSWYVNVSARARTCPVGGETRDQCNIQCVAKHFLRKCRCLPMIEHPHYPTCELWQFHTCSGNL
jgi:hypothetical protein